MAASGVLEAVPAVVQECSVCHEALGRDVGTLWCNHRGHESCMRQWFAISFTCPLCRSDGAKRLKQLELNVAREKFAVTRVEMDVCLALHHFNLHKKVRGFCLRARDEQCEIAERMGAPLHILGRMWDGLQGRVMEEEAKRDAAHVDLVNVRARAREARAKLREATAARDKVLSWTRPSRKRQRRSH